MVKEIKYIPWFIMTGLALFLFGITAEYLAFKPDTNFLLIKQEIVFDPVWRPTFYLHVISGMLVILVGPFQFLPKLRNWNLRLHKNLGKVYAFGILGIGAPTGLIMAFYAEGGTPSTIAFLVMSVLWFVTTLMAIYKARKKDILAHKKWMMRSFALSFAAVTLRLLVPLMSYSYEFNQETIVVSTAWLSWIINLLVVEGIIFVQFKNSRSARRKSSTS